MKIKTKYQGQVEITKEDIINFPKGILGFEGHKEFVLLDIEGNPHFKFLQDIYNEYISFLLIEPWDFFKDYDIELPDDKLKKINIDPKKEREMSIYNIVTLGQTLQDSTTNLLAPIVINLEDKEGKQFILGNSPYTTKHKLPVEGEGQC